MVVADAATPGLEPAVTAASQRVTGDQAFDLVPGESPCPGDIPWAYGENRVTAMARDPHWMFVYWELTDDAIERARAQVNASDAGCVLRAYDTTHRFFDGTNANWYMDIPVHRPANNHYVAVNRPGATFHVDIGVKSSEGYFGMIARSSPVEMPRDGMSTDTSVEWMTVASAGAGVPAYVHRVSPRPWPSPDGGWREEMSEGEVERVRQSLVGEGWSRSEWTETDMDGRTVRWIRWSGPVRREEWRLAGIGRHESVEILFRGERQVIRFERGERIVSGPWLVTIWGETPGGARRVVDRWTVHYAWDTEGGIARVETLPILRRIVDGFVERVPGGSEARLASWGSEALLHGASEWRWLGASERSLGGASELLFAGASEARYLGASEWLMAGASESLFVGASHFGGARELGGGSEMLFGGGSEMLGGSERLRTGTVLGASGSGGSRPDRGEDDR